MGSKYYDSSAAIQVIGCVLNNPKLLEDSGKYSFREEDFCNDFHRIVFAAAYYLQNNGAERLNRKVIEDYLEDYPKSYATYKANNGAEWMHKAFIEADILNFDYYYQRLKKMTLFRTYNEIGLDVNWLYDPDNILDPKKKEEQEKYIDEHSLNELAEEIDNRVLRVREMVVDNDLDESCQLGEGIEDLIESLQTTPIMGNPLWDPYFNEIALGARQGCFYLRSAGTGVGKSRSMMADACYLACTEYFNVDKNEWEKIGDACPTVFISVELDKEELQTMALAFISGVPENHIIRGEMSFEEIDRVQRAVAIINSSELYIEYFPDYSLKDIENCIKRNLRVHKATYIFLDYITSSMKIIEEVSKAAHGTKVREDQILFLLSSRLKDIATTYHVFIFSATQINGLAKDAKILDQNMLAGAKSIANRIDLGAIMVDCTPEDLNDIEGLLSDNPGIGVPNVKMSIYKNRRGEHNRVVLWIRADKSTCRYKTLFVTDYAGILVTNILKQKKGE